MIIYPLDILNMTLINDWKDYTHLSEDLAKALVSTKTEVAAARPELFSDQIEVNDDGVSIPTPLAFDLLYKHNRLLWEEVLDAFIDIAQEVYLEHSNVDPNSDHDSYLQNGVDVTAESITVLR